MRTFKRPISVILILLLILALLPAADAQTGTLVKNTGTRHVVCTVLSAQAEAYYTGIYTYDAVSTLSASASDPMNSEMFSRLHTLMASTMTNSVSYSSLNGYWPKTDANNGSDDPILFYSDVTSGSFNREHVWPKSRASFYQSNGGSDLHHLRPTNADVNSTRSNHTFGNVRGVLPSSSISIFPKTGDPVLWYNASGDGLVEVNDNIKGDVARILLYVWCRWEEPNLYENDPDPYSPPGDTGGNDGLKVIESLDTLLEWMELDPVDMWEMSRNDQCENVQGNRNVFIDYPEYAWLLFNETPPADYTTPSGEAGNYESYTITAAANNSEWGSVSISGHTVTATPNTGYYVLNAAVTPEGAAVLSRSDNTFRVTNVTGDCTVTVNFAAKSPVTVTFTDGIGLCSTTVQTYAGDRFVLPLCTNAGIDGVFYSFLGWASAEVADTAELPMILTGGTETYVDADTTYYAVYRYAVDDGTPDGWTQVTNAQDLIGGDEYAFICVPFASGNTENLALNTTVVSSNYWGGTAITVSGSFSDGSASASELPAEVIWTAEELDDDVFAFVNGGHVLALRAGNTNSAYKNFDTGCSEASASASHTCWRIRSVDSGNYQIRLSTDAYEGYCLCYAYKYNDFAAYPGSTSSANATGTCYMMKHASKAYRYTSTAGEAPTPTPTEEPSPTPTEEPTPTPTPTPKPTATPVPTAPPPVELPTEGDYVLRIKGGYVSEHTEQVSGADCLKVELFLDGVTSERLLSSISFSLLYDPAQLTYVKCKALSGSGMSVPNGTVPGWFRFAFVSTNGTLTDETKPLLTLWFTVADGLPADTQIEFAFSEEIKADSISSGSYTSQKRTVGAVLNPYLLSPMYGDANCDVKVTAADAAAVLRHLVQLDTLTACGLINANVDGNDAVSAEDAAMILRRVVRLIERFPAEE